MLRMILLSTTELLQSNSSISSLVTCFKPLHTKKSFLKKFMIIINAKIRAIMIHQINVECSINVDNQRD